jgi:hypothetical protein
VWAAGARAAEWSTIRPGESTQNDVRAMFGAPTKTANPKVEGYDTTQWIYEGSQAPKGMTKAVIDFGLLTPQGYRPGVVRQMLLEPRRGTFRLATIVQGWGEPDSSGVENGVKVLSYRSGLFVYFDKEGLIAERMYFTPPLPPAAGGAPPRR